MREGPLGGGEGRSVGGGEPRPSVKREGRGAQGRRMAESRGFVSQMGTSTHEGSGLVEAKASTGRGYEVNPSSWRQMYVDTSTSTFFRPPSPHEMSNGGNDTSHLRSLRPRPPSLHYSLLFIPLGLPLIYSTPPGVFPLPAPFESPLCLKPTSFAPPPVPLASSTSLPSLPRLPLLTLSAPSLPTKIRPAPSGSGYGRSYQHPAPSQPPSNGEVSLRHQTFQHGKAGRCSLDIFSGGTDDEHNNVPISSALKEYGTSSRRQMLMW